MTQNLNSTIKWLFGTIYGTLVLKYILIWCSKLLIHDLIDKSMISNSFYLFNLQLYLQCSSLSWFLHFFLFVVHSRQVRINQRREIEGGLPEGRWYHWTERDPALCQTLHWGPRKQSPLHSKPSCLVCSERGMEIPRQGEINVIKLFVASKIQVNVTWTTWSS